MQASAVMSQLSTLGQKDLLAVRQMTDMLLGSTLPSKPDDSDTLLFDAACQELAAHGLNGRIAYNTFRTSRYFKAWQAGVEVVEQFIEQHFKNYITHQVQRSALYRTFIESLIAELRRQKVPCSIGTIATNMHRVPQAFDGQFPGYLQAGLAYLVVKAMTTKRSK